MTDQPTPAPPGQPPAAYRELVARLEAERAKTLRNAPAARAEEVRCTLDGIASGLHIAIAHAITLFEGHDARQQYFAGEHPPAPAHDAGPTIAEATAADRNWDVDKAGER